MYCSKCGAQMENGSRFCIQCGNASSCNTDSAASALKKKGFPLVSIILAAVILVLGVIIPIVVLKSGGGEETYQLTKSDVAGKWLLYEIDDSLHSRYVLYLMDDGGAKLWEEGGEYSEYINFEGPGEPTARWSIVGGKTIEIQPIDEECRIYDTYVSNNGYAKLVTMKDGTVRLYTERGFKVIKRYPEVG